MAPIPIFHANAAKGRLEFPDKERVNLRRWLHSLDGQMVDVTVQPHRERRSLDQNAYWWGVPVELIAEHTGYTPDQAHYWLLGEWGGYIAGPGGREVPRIASSSRLNTEQFSKLIEWVLDWAPAELGVYVPPPEKAEAA